MSQADIDEEEKELKDKLKREIVENLKIESLKKEIVNEIQGKNANFSFSKFAQHPAFLIIMGFVLTGIIGSQLASRWQTREWDRQQMRLAQISGIEQKYKVIDEISKAIGEHNAAALHLITIVSRDLKNDARLNAELPELSKDWDKARSDWRAAESIIKQKIIVYFKNKEARDAFKRITEIRMKINTNLSSWLEEFNDSKLKKQLNIEDNPAIRTEENVETLTKLIGETSDEYEGMADLMVKEIQVTVEGK